MIDLAGIYQMTTPKRSGANPPAPPNQSMSTRLQPVNRLA